MRCQVPWIKYITTLAQCLTDISFRNLDGKEIGFEKGFSEWLDRT